MKNFSLISGIVVLVFALTGCGVPQLNLNVASLPNVNPDNSGRPSPVLIKVYELRNDLAFRQGDFQSLFEQPVPSLGADLIAADDLVFIPGEARKIIYKPAMSTRFIGVLAGFRQMERAKWRIIKPLDAEKDSIIALELNDATILPIPDNEAKRWDPEDAVKKFQTGGKQAGQKTAGPVVVPAQQNGNATDELPETTTKADSITPETRTVRDTEDNTSGSHRQPSAAPVRQMDRNP